MATGLLTRPPTSEPIPSSAGAPPDDNNAAAPAAEPDSPPAALREVVAVVGTIAGFDLLVYRGHGYAGYAAFFIAAAALLLFGTPKPRPRIGALVVGSMLALLAARMVWLGYGFLNVVGVALLVAFTMTLAGRRAYVLDVVAHGLQSILAGFPALARYGRSSGHVGTVRPRATWLKVVLPLVAVLGFGTIFILANPDIATAVGRSIQRGWDASIDFLRAFSPSVVEVLLWIVVTVVAAGLLRPLFRTHLLEWLAVPSVGAFDEDEPLFDAPLYAAYRNTLIAVVGLFAVYLAFEFTTLWFRDFPEGFYYAGYAHEGAAWLTVALALTTLVLSAIFRGEMLRDPRLPRLRKLAWTWSALNLLLAFSVYNRMFIYIDFNGMTRMRTVGLFGISAVVIGFLLCVWKITRNRDFAWLIERQLWTVSIAGFLLAILPIDPLIHTYNVRRVLVGDLAPSVQITEHAVDSGGVLALQPLLSSDNALIREGIRSLLADRALRLEAKLPVRRATGWTTYQAADELLLKALQARRSDWDEYADLSSRRLAWQKFKNYAYQWY
ncbi:MAG: DUF4173 domain-containing protein [Planctomycetaceae bacterium]|nr:DUF4173 domain-containing protein [Planctomycetaceae bacterium]